MYSASRASNRGAADIVEPMPPPHARALSTFDMDADLRNAFEKGKLTLYKAVVLSRFPVSERSEVLRRTLEEGRSTRWLRDELSRRRGLRSVTGSSQVGAGSAVHARGDDRGSLGHEAVEQVEAGLPPDQEAGTPHRGDVALPQIVQAEPVVEEDIVFTSSVLFDKMLPFYPYEILDEVWDRIPSDSLRIKFFPKLVGELWRIAKKRESPEALIARVMENLSDSG